jgi:hypothetical protein
VDIDATHEQMAEEISENFSIIGTPSTPVKQFSPFAQQALINAHAHLDKRRTKKLSRLFSLLKKINEIRERMGMKTITLKEFRDI